MNAALAGLVILVIGDSQMKGLIYSLHDELESDGAAIHSYLMCGATAQDWLAHSTVSCGRGERHEHGAPSINTTQTLPTYRLPDLIAQNHPNLVIVELGEKLEPDHSWVKQEVHTLATRIAANHLPCVWVGPTWGQNKPSYPTTDASVTDITQLLAGSVAPCSFFDSTTFARPGELQTVDGTHLTPDGYRRWGKAIADGVVRLHGQGALTAR
jgi:lysophospholipase L1-like esterase